MADNLEIKFVCEVCNGTGIVTTGTVPQEVQCTNCNGDGFASEGYLDGSGDVVDAIAEVFTDVEKQYLKDKVDSIQDKVDDIWEKLNE